jgi:hypothetical protein
MFGWTTADLLIRHFIRQPEHGEGQRAHKLLIMLVGVAGFLVHRSSTSPD